MSSDPLMIKLRKGTLAQMGKKDIYNINSSQYISEELMNKLELGKNQTAEQ